MAWESRQLLPAALALAVCACDGSIGEAPRTPGLPGSTTPDVPPTDPAYCRTVTPEPGRVTIRRLNRLEYNNTVRDLLGDVSRPADAFPQDDVSSAGFDNDGDILSLGELHMEKYDAAAIALAGAALAPGSAFRDRYLPCAGATGVAAQTACARTFVETFGLRAWRRPLAPAEVDRLVALYESARTEGESFDDATKRTARAMLLSPKFLFRVERIGTADGGVRPLDDYELASRLSYFLWSSMPDEALLEAAAGGALQDRDRIRAEVDRMLGDPKASAFYESFVGQWLQLRELDYVTPDRARFPDFDDALRRSMERETIALVRHLIDGGEPVASLLTARYTFLNARLAGHYGVAGVSGTTQQRVELPADSPRGGLLAQGSFLTVTSHPTSTSPVKRGAWVLDRLLCAPPPDPPPDVDTMFESAETGGTLRERLERHRADPACAVCHSIMDPIGFGLEHFDAVGAWRDMDNGEPIDATGVLEGGAAFDGSRELASAIATDGRLAECVTKKLTTYALGRALAPEDRCYVEAVLERAGGEGLSLRELLVQIVTNEVFTTVGGRLEAEP